MQLSPRIKRAAFQFASSAVVCAGAAVLISTVLQPPEDTIINESTVSYALEPKSEAAESKQISLDDYAAVWKRRLQRPLVDPPVAPPPKAEVKIVETAEPPALPQVAAPDVELRSIIHSPQRSLAVFAAAGGAEVICGIGEKIADATVKSIEVDKVTLEKESQEFSFAIEPAKKR